MAAITENKVKISPFLDIVNDESYQTQYELLLKQTKQQISSIEISPQIKGLQCLTVDELKKIETLQTKERCFLQECYKKFTQPCQCRYCGHLFCELHGKKQVKSKRACTICFDQHNLNLLITDFQIDKKTIQHQINKIKEEEDDLDLKIKTLQQEFDMIQQRQSYDISTFQLQNFDTLEEENKKQLNTAKDIQSQIKSQQQTIQQKDKNLEEKGNEIQQRQDLLQQKLGAQTQILEKVYQQEIDIKKTTDVVDTIQQKITEYNFQIEKLEIGNDNSLQHQVQYQRQQEEMMSRIKEEQEYKKQQEYNATPTPGNDEQIDEEDPQIEFAQSNNKKSKNKKINKKHKKQKNKVKKEKNEGQCGVDACSIF